MYKEKKSDKMICQTCGFQFSKSNVLLRCPRCLTSLHHAYECSGNCSKCGKHNKC